MPCCVVLSFCLLALWSIRKEFLAIEFHNRQIVAWEDVRLYLWYKPASRKGLGAYHSIEIVVKVHCEVHRSTTVKKVTKMR